MGLAFACDHWHGSKKEDTSVQKKSAKAGKRRGQFDSYICCSSHEQSVTKCGARGREADEGNPKRGEIKAFNWGT